MSRLTLDEMCLANMDEEFTPEFLFVYMPREAAYEQLKWLTGQDFGYDTAAWRKWLKANKGYLKKRVPDVKNDT